MATDTPLVIVACVLLDIDPPLSFTPVDAGAAPYVRAVRAVWPGYPPVTLKGALTEDVLPPSVWKPLKRLHLHDRERWVYVHTSLVRGAAAASDPPDDARHVEGYLLGGSADFFEGRLESASEALRRVSNLYDTERHAVHAQRYGVEPGVIGLGWQALTCWLLGDPVRALEHADAALALAVSVEHPFSLCQCHALLALLHQFRGDVAQIGRASCRERV